MEFSFGGIIEKKIRGYWNWRFIIFFLYYIMGLVEIYIFLNVYNNFFKICEFNIGFKFGEIILFWIGCREGYN